ncbi:MAG: M28 family peptidase, partial [Nitrososphaerales archaeon]
MKVSKHSLRKHVDYLSSPELKGREFGSEECKLAALYVKKHFEEYNIAAPDKYPDYLQILPWGGQNVLGVLHGNDPELSNECMIVDAHQDHMGDGFAGASDNAAGVAILLELTRIFTESNERARRSILFACFDGEEQIVSVDGKKQLMQ